MGANSSAPAEKEVLEQLDTIGQNHLVAGWTLDTPAADKQRFLTQVTQLNGSYPGGLKQYVENARKLLAESKAGVWRGMV